MFPDETRRHRGYGGPDEGEQQREVRRLEATETVDPGRAGKNQSEGDQYTGGDQDRRHPAAGIPNLYPMYHI